MKRCSFCPFTPTAKHYNSESNYVSNPNTATFTTACSSLHIVTNSVICNDHIPLCTPETCALLGVELKAGKIKDFDTLHKRSGKQEKVVNTHLF